MVRRCVGQHHVAIGGDHDRVDIGATIECVSGLTRQAVEARATVEQIDTRPADHRVVAVESVELGCAAELGCIEEVAVIATQQLGPLDVLQRVDRNNADHRWGDREGAPDQGVGRNQCADGHTGEVAGERDLPAGGQLEDLDVVATDSIERCECRAHILRGRVPGDAGGGLRAERQREAAVGDAGSAGDGLFCVRTFAHVEAGVGENESRVGELANGVDAEAAEDLIDAFATTEDVVGAAAAQNIVTLATEQRDAAQRERAGIDDVVAVLTGDHNHGDSVVGRGCDPKGQGGVGENEVLVG